MAYSRSFVHGYHVYKRLWTPIYCWTMFHCIWTTHVFLHSSVISDMDSFYRDVKTVFHVVWILKVCVCVREREIYTCTCDMYTCMYMLSWQQRHVHVFCGTKRSLWQTYSNYWCQLRVHNKREKLVSNMSTRCLTTISKYVIVQYMSMTWHSKHVLACDSPHIVYIQCMVQECSILSSLFYYVLLLIYMYNHHTFKNMAKTHTFGTGSSNKHSRGIR